jgi:hypothetical protein
MGENVHATFDGNPHPLQIGRVRKHKLLVIRGLLVLRLLRFQAACV